MSHSPVSHRFILKRFLTSLAAIAAVTAVFGVKAMEWEQRAAIAAAQDASPAVHPVVQASLKVSP